jgi:GTPase SAR1 family protein
MALPPKTGMPALPAKQDEISSISLGVGPAIIRGITRQAHRIVLYGAGGIGKTSLATKLPNSVILDIEDGSMDFDVARIPGREIKNWNGLREIVQSNILNEFDSIILDTATKAEQWAVQWTLANISNDKGKTLRNIESYGYGKGYSLVYETFLCLMGDLDRLFLAGKNIIVICHDCTEKVPNPDADDYIRWEPRLQNKGNGNIRAYIKEWADHLIFIGYDVAIGDDDKAKGKGTRTIYTAEEATLWAKSRSINAMPFKYEKDSEQLWEILFQKGDKK